MEDESALKQARAQLAELLEAAKKGTIIPFRLPGQIEAIEALLAKAEGEGEAASQASAQDAPSADLEEYMKSHAAFVSHAVHELRTPVTSIRGYSDMLNNPAMGELNDMQKQFLTVIRTNTKRMEGLLSDVSYVTKIRAGTLRANQKMDMYKNIAMMLEKNARPLAEELGRKLVIDEVPQGLPLLNIDGEMLSNALLKLIENGLRYSPEGEGTVRVSAASQDGTLVITVEDNGIGMTPEEIAQLGTLYFRGDNDAVRAYKGSGLGIPIAYGLIKLLDGAISVESEPGEGTRFTITLKGMSSWKT